MKKIAEETIMAGTAVNFKDCPVFIHDEEGNYIAKAIISAYFKPEMRIVISGGHEDPENFDDIKIGTRVNILIIHPDSTYEFGGVTRTNNGSSCEITLFRERERTGRASSRHSLDTPAFINRMIVDSAQEQFSEPVTVIIENISATGVLVRSPLMRFKKGTALEFEVNINGKDVLLDARVVREQTNDDGSDSYGCQFIFRK